MWNWILDLLSWDAPLEPECCRHERIVTSPAQIIEEHESYILELQEEKEKQAAYEIVLWWGLDGLKLKADGTTEWISRRKSKQDNNRAIQVSLPFHPIKQHYTSDDVRALQAQLNAMKAAEMILHTSAGTQSTQSRLEELRSSQMQNIAATFNAIDMRNAYWSGDLVRNCGVVAPIYAPNSTIYSTNVVNIYNPPPRQVSIGLKISYGSE